MLILVNFIFCNFNCGILFYVFHIAAYLTLLLLVLSGTQCTFGGRGSNCFICMGCCLYMWLIGTWECKSITGFELISYHFPCRCLVSHLIDYSCSCQDCVGFFFFLDSEVTIFLNLSLINTYLKILAFKYFTCELLIYIERLLVLP